MKKILLTITAFVVTLLAVAQSPNLLNYQGVARNTVGNVLPSQPIGLRLSILSGGPTGTPVYTETRNVTTNAFGLFNVQVGSPGAITTTGTIAGINWTAFGVGSGSKFLQVEIDPVGGTNYFNVGSTQLVSVPYSLYAGAAAPVGPAGGDLTGTYPNPQIFFPLIKTFNASTLTPANTQLLGLTNSATTGTLGAITGTSASNDANATAIMGTMSSTSPGAFSTAVKGVNNGTGGLGIGVWGGQAGSGWGVYGTAPNGIGVNGVSTTGTGVSGSSTSGVGVAGTSNTNSSGVFTNGNAANTANTLVTNTNGAGDAIQAINSGTGKAGSFTINNAANANFAVDALSNGTNSTVNSTNTGTGAAGTFTVNNTASTADALRAVTNGVGASWAIRATSTGTNGAGLFISNNPTASNNNLQSNTNGLGRAGLFNSTNAASTANGVDINVAGTGYALRAASTNATARALQTAGALQLTGIGEGAPNPPNAFKILAGDATGNATWQHASAIGVASGSGTLNFVPKWTPNGTTLGNSQIFDNGTSVGIGTTTPNAAYIVDIQSNVTQMRLRDNDNNSEILITAPGTGYTGGVGTLTNHDLPLFTGNTDRMTIKVNGDVGIETANPQHRLSVGPTTADAQTVMVRGFGNSPLNWKGGGAFGNTNASAILGELNGVASIGGHNSNLSAWTPFAINPVPGNNVGIGTAAPTYALDVNHNGANGLHVRSLASFSVVDLDAANGDAALRYQNAGTTRWNVRNAPGTNDYQIVRNNSLPANLTINNGTGYVGIVQTAPTYQLDILHAGGASGARGIRTKSTASYSVVDIDAANGDEALRFLNNGVGDWHIGGGLFGGLNFLDLKTGQNRMLIQNVTGNVGVGTILPNARLDVDNPTASTRGIQVINTVATNNSSALYAQTDNITSASFFEGSAVTGVMPLNVASTMVAGATSVKGIASTNAAVSQFSGIGVQGASAAGYGVVGNTNSGVALAGISWGSGYGLYTVGKVQIEGQGAALNRILRSDANGNATWETLTSIGGVSGTGTLNFVPKWSPDGTTLANSLAFDNGVTYSIGSNSPTTDQFYVSNAASNTWATVNQVGTNVGGMSFTRANAYKYDIAMNAADDFYVQNYTSGSTALTILGANSNVGINQPAPTARLDVNGTFKLTDGTQGAGKILVSDAAGNASWQTSPGIVSKFSSAWIGAFDAPSRDTSIDGTLTKVYFVAAPEITPAVLASGNITVYMRVGGIGPYELPYISNAGGRANAVQAFFANGKIGITRPTFNEVAPNNINLPGTLEFRYVIIQ